MSDAPPEDGLRRCLSCGAPLAASSRVLSCRACLLKVGFSAPVSGDVQADPSLVAGALLPTGTRLDRYVIIRKVGEGGMGVVYVAEQEGPVTRTVAIKVIKPGMDTLAVVRRFEAERRTLGLMSHPHIAQVTDAGTTRDGHPYFVMEWVDGPPLTLYCDDRKLDLRARLGLFLDVCAAVRHAHQRGVIHCDLKPGNVLVAEIEGEAVPKVIDFGVSRAVDPEARMAFTWLTMADLGAAGTPAYMAPEQASGAGDIDIRVDVYALGAVLYELLCGSAPFDRNRTGRRVDAEESAAERRRRPEMGLEPERPSTRVSAGGGTAAADIATLRSSSLAALRASIRGELEWIILKAMESDRERRYASVAHLAEDLERHLNDEPVSASPPSLVYRFRKFARRHRYGLAAAAAVFLALAGGVVASTHLAVKASRAEAKAVARREQGERLVDFMLDALYGELKEIGRLELLEGVVDEVLAYHDSVVDVVGEADRIRLSSAYTKMAWVKDRKGERREAEKIARLALRFVDGNGAEESRALRFARAQRKADLGTLVRQFENLDESFALLDAAILEVDALAAEIDASEDELQAYRRILAGIYNNRGSTHIMRKEWSKAFGDYTHVASLRKQLLASDPESAATRDDLAKISLDLARVEERLDELDAAIRHSETAVAIRRGLAGELPKEHKWRSGLADSLKGHAAVLRARGELDEAYTSARESVSIWAGLCASQPDNVTWKEAQGRSLHLFCSIGAELGYHAEILDEARKAVVLREELLVIANGRLRERVGLVYSLGRLGKTLEMTGHSHDALTIYRRLATEGPAVCDALPSEDATNRKGLAGAVKAAVKGAGRLENIMNQFK